MTGAASSATSSDMTMESVDSLALRPAEELRAFVQHANAILRDSMDSHTAKSSAPSHLLPTTDAAPATNSHPKISCDTFTAQATKFSGEDLCMSAASWVDINKHKFAAYLPGVQEQMQLNAAYL